MQLQGWAGLGDTCRRQILCIFLMVKSPTPRHLMQMMQFGGCILLLLCQDTPLKGSWFRCICLPPCKKQPLSAMLDCLPRLRAFRCSYPPVPNLAQVQGFSLRMLNGTLTGASYASTLRASISGSLQQYPPHMSHLAASSSSPMFGAILGLRFSWVTHGHHFTLRAYTMCLLASPSPSSHNTRNCRPLFPYTNCFGVKVLVESAFHDSCC